MRGWLGGRGIPRLTNPQQCREYKTGSDGPGTIDCNLHKVEPGFRIITTGGMLGEQLSPCEDHGKPTTDSSGEGVCVLKPTSCSPE